MKIDQLKLKSNSIRRAILEMSIRSGGHIASSFSCVEILVMLYHGGVLKIDPKNPKWDGRDRFFLSKGHAETGLYAVLADMGFFPSVWLDTCYRRGRCRLGGHPDRKIPGVEITSGSLGHGMGVASGCALAAKMDGKPHSHFVLLGDAECTEGSVWEAAMFAQKHELANLFAIVDRNHIGSLDYTKNYTGLEPFEDKWRAFGWDIKVCNGHCFTELFEAVEYAGNRHNSQPFVLIAETVKGKGVSFMENEPSWHVRSLTEENEIAQARKELREGRDANTTA